MKNSKPAYRAYVVENYKDAHGNDQSYWMQIGSVWEHENGDGFDVVLKAFPVNGRVTIRKPLPPKQQGESASA